jgi:hypothetical protein
MAERDRDESGRPRNTRPRDGTVTLVGIYGGAVGFGAVAMDQLWVVDISGGSVERGDLMPDGTVTLSERWRPGRMGGVRTATASYKGHRFPVEIIDHCVWL